MSSCSCGLQAMLRVLIKSVNYFFERVLFSCCGVVRLKMAWGIQFGLLANI